MFLPGSAQGLALGCGRQRYAFNNNAPQTAALTMQAATGVRCEGLHDCRHRVELRSFADQMQAAVIYKGFVDGFLIRCSRMTMHSVYAVQKQQL